MRWCCAQFQGLHSEAGMRGMGVFARRSVDGAAYFVLQNRATEPNVSVSTTPLAPISLVSEIGIQFCPWCGVRLLEHYRDEIASLERPDLAVPI